MWISHDPRAGEGQGGIRQTFGRTAAGRRFLGGRFLPRFRAGLPVAALPKLALASSCSEGWEAADAAAVADATASRGGNR